MRALEDGPGTTREIAIETGLPLRHCSAYLSLLVKKGLVERSSKPDTPMHGFNFDRPAYRYGLPGHLTP